MKQILSFLLLLACCQLLAQGCKPLINDMISTNLSTARAQLTDALEECPSLKNAINLAKIYQKLGDDRISYEVMQDATNSLLITDNDKKHWLLASISFAMDAKNICQVNKLLNELHALVGNSIQYKKLHAKLYQLTQNTVLSSQTIACSLTATRSVTTRSMKIRAKIDLAIHFDFNSADLTIIGQQQVKQLAKALHVDSISKKNIYLIGHTDQIGAEQYNLSLSQRRSRRIADYLIGLDSSLENRINATGVGESQLLSYGNNEEDHQLNRRVEIQLD